MTRKTTGQKVQRYDLIVVGTGLAGLSAALHAARHGRVALLSAARISGSSTYLAQGGVAAAIGPGDTPAQHLRDTLEAGRGLCDRRAVHVLVTDGVRCVRELIDWGMPFERNSRGFNLGLEGGHGRRRILHAGGNETGKALVDFLMPRVRAHPEIHIVDRTYVSELLMDSGRCIGVRAYSVMRGEPQVFLGRAVVLATGGCAGLYRRTTNAPASTGDGIAAAFLAGAEISDMEFLQFHPTGFYAASGRGFLISEAVRGEGAYLVNARGYRFMPDYHEAADLAPRDVVARAIIDVMRREGSAHVWLRMRAVDPEKIRHRFANIAAACREHGVDVTRHDIPVVPVAHHLSGGIRTGLSGETNLPGLYACGECACTGVHGANRLASNSLLEALVFSRRAVEAAAHEPRLRSTPSLPPARRADRPLDYAALRRKVARLLSARVGMVRNEPDLARALGELAAHQAALPDASSGIHAMRAHGFLIVARLIATAARARQETRGAHTREEFPRAERAWRGHLVFQGGWTPRFIRLRP